MRGVAFALLAMLATDGVARLSRGSNSRSAVRRGIEKYQARDYTAAEGEFATASKIRPSPDTSFNLGTARIAAGDNAGGAAALGDALTDAAIAPDALFNRGTGALAARAYDHAVRDFEATLRVRPGDAAAKRNLEIALRRREQAGQQGQQPPQQQSGPPQPNPPQQQRQRGEDREAEALLRSVEQQEREELSRMRRARGRPARVGW